MGRRGGRGLVRAHRKGFQAYPPAFHAVWTDRPPSRTALGTFYARRGMAIEAEAELQAALRLSPGYPPPP